MKIDHKLQFSVRGSVTLAAIAAFASLSSVSTGLSAGSPPQGGGANHPPGPPPIVGGASKQAPLPSAGGSGGAKPPLPPMPPAVSGSNALPVAFEGYREEIELSGVAASDAMPAYAALNLNTVDGASQSSLEIKAGPIAAGTYDVSVTLVSTGSTVTLATLPYRPVLSGSQQAGKGMPMPPAPKAGALPPPLPPFHVEFGTKEHPFPAGVTGSDIATISVADHSNSKVILTGDFTQASAERVITIDDNLPVVPGAAAPKAKGMLHIHGVEQSGSTTSSFALDVNGLPATVTASLAINGAAVANLTVDSKGNLLVVGGALPPKPENASDHAAKPVAAPAPSSNPPVQLPPAPQKLPASVDILGIKGVSLQFGNGSELLHVNL